MARTKLYVIVALMFYALVVLLRGNLPRLIPGFCTIAILAPVVTQCRAQANNVYIAQTAAGSANGSSCSSPYAVNYFNSPANWTSGTPSGAQIGPGTTVHLCGVFSVPAGTSNFLEFQGNGAKGKPVTLLFEPGAVLSSPYWSGPAINLRGKSYVTVDGGTNGIIQATANGTNLRNQVDDGECVVSQATQATDVIVQNLTCSNLYIDASQADSGGEDTYGIDIWGTSNLTIRHNTIHDVKWGIRNSYSTGKSYSNLTVSGNTIYDIDHGWFATDSSSSGSAVMSGFYVFSNTIHDFQNWDNSGNRNHHDAFHLNTNSASSHFSNVFLYNNYVYGAIGSYMNSLFFSYPASPASESNVWVFNNLFVNSSPTYCMANGFVALVGVGTQYVLNNTFLSRHTSCTELSRQQESGYIAEDGSTGITNENNIFINTTSRALQFSPAVGRIMATDFNDFYENDSWEYNGSSYATLAGWMRASSFPIFDAHSITANPQLSTSYVPQAGSAVIGRGANLSLLCSGQPNPGLGALCSDKGGHTRPSTGGWDMGAYTSAAAGSTSLSETIQ